MSRTVRQITAELFSTGLSADQMALVTELAVASVSDASGRSKHALAQARYQAKKQAEMGDGHDQRDHSDQNDQGGSPPHDIKNSSPPTPSSKPKRVSRSVAIDVPEEIHQSAINFAVSHGWEMPKIRAEWERFRNWSLNKGRKHRRLDSAWQNWVTSPFQANGSANGQQSHGNRAAQGSGSAGQDAILAGVGRIADRIRQRGDAERREREMADGDDLAGRDDARLI